MAKLSDRQANLIYRNASALNLPYEDERALQRMHAIEMEPTSIASLMEGMWGFLRAVTEETRMAYRNEVLVVVDEYRDQLKNIP
jgi:hypothetical protein